MFYQEKANFVKKRGESYTFQCYLVLWDEYEYCVFLYADWQNV